jgi:hypothetical protein
MKHLRQSSVLISDSGQVRQCGYWGAAIPREIVEILEAPRQLSSSRIKFVNGNRQISSLPQSRTPAQLNRFRAA